MPNNEPRKIKTLAVKGRSRPDAAPAGSSDLPRSRRRPPHGTALRRAPIRASANASANAPLSLSPQVGARPEPAATRMASDQSGATAPASSGGGYVVQVSSQKNEADAQASYRALQGKYPERARLTVVGGEARRSRRKGRLLPGVCRSVQLGGSGDAGLQ